MKMATETRPCLLLDTHIGYAVFGSNCHPDYVTCRLVTELEQNFVF